MAMARNLLIGAEVEAPNYFYGTEIDWEFFLADKTANGFILRDFNGDWEFTNEDAPYLVWNHDTNSAYNDVLEKVVTGETILCYVYGNKNKLVSGITYTGLTTNAPGLISLDKSESPGRFERNVRSNHPGEPSSYYNGYPVYGGSLTAYYLGNIKEYNVDKHLVSVYPGVTYNSPKVFYNPPKSMENEVEVYVIYDTVVDEYITSGTFVGDCVYLGNQFFQDAYHAAAQKMEEAGYPVVGSSTSYSCDCVVNNHHIGYIDVNTGISHSLFKFEPGTKKYVVVFGFYVESSPQ